LKNLYNHARETREFFSNKTKPERERAVCRAFLRTIGVTFKECELIAPAVEPADVAFRTARFQIRELLEPERRRGDDWKKKEQNYSEAESLEKLEEEKIKELLLEPYSPPKPVNIETLFPKIVEALSEKSRKYGTGCKNIDALVYVNREDLYLKPDSNIPNIAKLQSQGWRSVSFLFPPYGVVLYSTVKAPDFLNSIKPGQYMKWSDIETLFSAGS